MKSGLKALEVLLFAAVCSFFYLATYIACATDARNALDGFLGTERNNISSSASTKTAAAGAGAFDAKAAKRR